MLLSLHTATIICRDRKTPLSVTLYAYAFPASCFTVVTYGCTSFRSGVNHAAEARNERSGLEEMWYALIVPSALSRTRARSPPTDMCMRLHSGSGGIRTHGTRSSQVLLLSRQATSPARPRCHSFTTGFEPATSGALGPRSATELRARCPRWGSNPRPPACEAGALPLSYADARCPRRGSNPRPPPCRSGAPPIELPGRPFVVARPAGFEPSVFPLRRRVPIHSATSACGAPGRTRTCMSLLRREVPIPWTTGAWYSWWDSNPRHDGSEPSALPLSYRSGVVGGTRTRTPSRAIGSQPMLATSFSTTTRGVPGGGRTRNLLVRNQVLLHSSCRDTATFMRPAPGTGASPSGGRKAPGALLCPHGASRTWAQMRPGGRRVP